MYCKLLNLNSSPILELSVKFVSQICHENINKLLDGAYLADFGIDFSPSYSFSKANQQINKVNKPAEIVDVLAQPSILITYVPIYIHMTLGPEDT